MSGISILRSFAESREADHVIIRDGITYGTAREALAQIAAERAAVVRYLRAMAKGLLDKTGRWTEETIEDRALRRDAALLEGAALDIEQGLHLDPDRLRELGVTE